MTVIIGYHTEAHATQKTYRVGNFSDEFFATVTVQDTPEVFKPGEVSVFDARSGKRMLRVKSEALSFDVKDGKVTANVKELPYGDQSVLIYEDFDFDGRKDLALMDGQNSCYHGPSFQIFLRKNASFLHSSAFTELAQEFCGMFGVDAAAKRLFAMTKNGCCWHRYNTYAVVNHAPSLIESVEESMAEFCPAYYARTVTVGRPSTEYFLPAWQDDSWAKPLCPSISSAVSRSGSRCSPFRRRTRKSRCWTTHYWLARTASWSLAISWT